MQVLVPFEGEAEDYSATAAERTLPTPPRCPNCGATGKLRHHGYYERFVSSQTDGSAMRLRIRRLRCDWCRLTTSLLPWFCLPYRLVRGESVARFLRGDGIDSRDLQWQGLLIRCRQRFIAWRPHLSPVLQSSFGCDMGSESVRSSWIRLEHAFGNIARATEKVVRRFRITLFGRYRCHSSGCRRSAIDYHTTLLFSGERSPPN